MIGTDRPVPVEWPATTPFGGREDEPFAQAHIHGPEGVSLQTRAKVTTIHWPHAERPAAASQHPTAT